MINAKQNRRWKSRDPSKPRSAQFIPPIYSFLVHEQHKAELVYSYIRFRIGYHMKSTHATNMLSYPLTFIFRFATNPSELANEVQLEKSSIVESYRSHPPFVRSDASCVRYRRLQPYKKENGASYFQLVPHKRTPSDTYLKHTLKYPYLSPSNI
jgi:hypothetical protein